MEPYGVDTGRHPTRHSVTRGTSKQVQISKQASGNVMVRSKQLFFNSVAELSYQRHSPGLRRNSRFGPNGLSVKKTVIHLTFAKNCKSYSCFVRAYSIWCLYTGFQDCN